MVVVINSIAVAVIALIVWWFWLSGRNDKGQS